MPLALPPLPSPPASPERGQRREAAPCAPLTARRVRARQARRVPLALHSLPPLAATGRAAPRGCTMCAAGDASRLRETHTSRAARAPHYSPPPAPAGEGSRSALSPSPSRGRGIDAAALRCTECRAHVRVCYFLHECTLNLLWESVLGSNSVSDYDNRRILGVVINIKMCARKRAPCAPPSRKHRASGINFVAKPVQRSRRAHNLLLVSILTCTS